MKTFFLFLLTLLAAAGIYIGLLYSQIVPAAPLARSSQLAAVALEGMGLYSPAGASTQPPMASASPNGTRSALDDEEVKLDAEKAKLEAKKASLIKSFTKHSLTREVDTPVAEGPISPKLADIYNTMKPDDLARIFDKQPDSEVVRALEGMNEKNAGRVLAVMSNARAARITAILGRP